MILNHSFNNQIYTSRTSDAPSAVPDVHKIHVLCSVHWECAGHVGKSSLTSIAGCHVSVLKGGKVHDRTLIK